MLGDCFIPKPGKSYYEDPKSFRPISLTSVLLKTLEKLCHRYIRSRVLSRNRLSPMQHAHQKSRLERSINDKEMALVVFLDIEEAFERVNSSVLIKAMRDFGLGHTLEKFIRNLVKQRTVEARVGEARLNAAVSCGFPRGGVLSPLLWSMVVDSLLVALNAVGLYSQGYADDICIVVRGKFLPTLCELMQRALGIVERSCIARGLTVNPGKTALIIFTRRKKLDGFRAPRLFG